MIDIQPVERDGKHYVEIVMDGDAMAPRGPFPSAAEADAMAVRMAAICRAMHAVVHLHADDATAAACR